MRKEIWFRASDGLELSVEEGSVAFGLMANDGGFKRIDGPGGDAAPAAEPEAGAKPDLSKLTKKQLYEAAVEKNVPVTDKMSKAEIIAALEAADEGSGE